MSIARCGKGMGHRAGFAKAVMVDGKIYDTITEAAESMALKQGTLEMRCRRYDENNTWPRGWGYV